MQRSRTVLGLVGAVSVIGMAVAPQVASASGHDGAVTVLKTGLSSPRGLALNANSDLVIGQGAFGPPGPALIYDLTGANRGQVRPKTEPQGLTDVAISPLDGTGWGIQPVPGPNVNGDENPDAHLVHRLADGTVRDVLDIAAYQAADPDPTDQEGLPTDSNPFGLTVDTNGDALFTDAGGNDLIRVTPQGEAVTVARFDLEAVGTDHLPPDLPFPLPQPLPPTLTAEAVPTTVGVGPDGAYYVGELKGFPFRPGTSRIWRVEPGAVGATCSVDDSTRDRCSVYSSGWTGIQDIAYDASTGTLYVYELSSEGVLAFEEGLAPAGSLPPAVLWAVDARHPDRGRHELAKGQLSQPGGVVATRGHVYVTDGVFTGGRLLEVHGDHS
jgi:hypothetical protein